MIEYLKKHIPQAMLWLLTVIGSWLFGLFQSSVAPFVINLNPSVLFWFMICFALLFLIMLSLVIYYLGQLNPKEHYKKSSGLLWDKELNPCCPINKNILQNYTREPESHAHMGFMCPSCKIFHALMKDEDGGWIDLKTARARLSTK